MAKYELPIYGDNDEVTKMHETNICPWGVYIQAADMQEQLKDKSAREQMDAVGEILKAVFPALTDAELLHADGADVMNTFQQIVSGGQKIKGSNSKNA
ncbi:MAG: hypothetical protein J6R46_00470 [Clostridia bacterium]|nr:hypothetical protein [Clostridia bacterium]